MIDISSNRFFELTRKGYSGSEEFLLPVHVYVISMIQEQYLPYYEIKDSLMEEFPEMGDRDVLRVMEYLLDGGYIRYV